ncbi:tRNA (uracil-O(2)-)-methyltransferase [Penicillium malachiteum]|uniref:tRNA (uracil-O(2)-)-methyltransferase n=1 Tax=Penicillium malachiteum TaxID=1324776 RepID=A0AAD6HJJ7_9EURO|nr:tRNA (uracil-O(2)-)-methyltransferase [Penicillium malachiteum]
MDDMAGLNDNIIPHEAIHNTYLRLKKQYEKGLCDKWLDRTESVNHIFQDLTIAAFLIELWSDMYGARPRSESSSETANLAQFPGFVDIACGNGVVVYVLLMEGYSGWGFDARRRDTWSYFPAPVQERLKEKMLVPKPFIDIVGSQEIGMEISTADFAPGTFVISNHADELTVWTPLLAALASPNSPLPFLVVPCCSHSLSGSTYRYPTPKDSNNPGASQDDHQQSASGDLRALRAAKQKEKTAEGRMFSQYGALVTKTTYIAEQVGYQVENTILNILSPRNAAIVGVGNWSQRNGIQGLNTETRPLHQWIIKPIVCAVPS